MTRYSTAVRVAGLEALIGRQGPLTVAERRELAALDAEMAAAKPIDDMDMAQLDDFLAAHASDPSGKLRRHAELQRRNRSPAEIEADEAFDALPLAERDDLIAMQSYLAPSSDPAIIRQGMGAATPTARSLPGGARGYGS